MNQQTRKQIEILKPLISRYLLYAVGLLDVLLLPKILPSNVYGEFEYIKNLVFLFPNALLGVYGGYVYIKYVKQVDTFDTIVRIGIIHTIIVSIIVGVLINNWLIVIPLIIINLYTLIEQKLKVEKYFITIFSYKPLLSIVIVFLASDIVLSARFSANELIFWSFIVSFTLWLILVKKTNIKWIPKIYPITLFELKKYFFIIKKIISSVLVSVILSLLFFSERYFVQKYYPSSLGTYSFGYNLCQIMIILIGSLGYISTIHLGEQLNDLTYLKILKGLINILLGYSILFLLFLFGVAIINPFYDEFIDLFQNVALISFAKGLYYAIGILTPILVYKDFSNQMFAGSLILLIINFLLNLYLCNIKIQFIFILIFNNVSLIFYCVYVIYLLLKRVKYQ